MLRLMQVHFPPIAHALMYVVDALTNRQPLKDTGSYREPGDPAASSALTSSLTGAITKMVGKSNPCGLCLPALCLVLLQFVFLVLLDNSVLVMMMTHHCGLLVDLTVWPSAITHSRVATTCCGGRATRVCPSQEVPKTPYFRFQVLLDVRTRVWGRVQN